MDTTALQTWITANPLLARLVFGRGLICNAGRTLEQVLRTFRSCHPKSKFTWRGSP